MAVAVAVRDGILRITFTGTVTSADIARMIDEVEAVERVADPSPPRITDFTEARELAFSVADVRGIAGWRKAVTPRGYFKSAVVAPRPVHVGFARMYQILGEHPQVELRVFSTKADALAWIGDA